VARAVPIEMDMVVREERRWYRCAKAVVRHAWHEARCQHAQLLVEHLSASRVESGLCQRHVALLCAHGT